MRKRRILLILFPVAAVVIVGLVMVLTRELEPEYGGKKLSEWLFLLSRDGRPTSQAAVAIREIGTNAYPYLLSWMAYETPRWKMNLHGAVYPILKRISNPATQSPLLNYKAELRADVAGRALEILGRPLEAIPDLERLLNAPRARMGAVRAAQILTKLGAPGLSALSSALTNRNDAIRGTLAQVIGYMGTNAQPAVPGLLKLLKDADPFVRQAATNAVRKIDPEAMEKTNAQ